MRLSLACWSLLLSAASTASAFTVVVGPTAVATRSASAAATSSVLFSEPSDTSNDEDTYRYQDVIMDVESTTSTSSNVVLNVMDLIPGSLGSSVSSETRAAINEALLKLESLNPTPEPTVSPLLNGVWELRYVGGYASDWAMQSPTRSLALFLYSGGYSPGLFALEMAQKLPAALVDTSDLEISISREQPRVEAAVKVKLFGGAESNVKVKTRLDVQSGIRLRETYESATVLDRDVEIPKPLQYARDLYVTYVDEDLLVVRDGSGVPEVLIRKAKTFSQNWGTEPSEVEDMVPPGEES